ncbi:MAG: hypothetical protein J5911_04695 [Clostridia bacterium]|nr:hypothetical protein [Clostridia bacterium]
MKSSCKNLLKLILFILFTAATALSFAAFYSRTDTAFAAPGETTVFLPFKSEEYYALNAPIHAYSDGNITAITESTVLHILKGNEVYTKAERSSLNQVKCVNDYLYFNDFAMIHKLPINDLSAEPQYIDITGTYFDINDYYIVTIYESIIKIYKTSDLTRTYKTIQNVQNKPIAINSENLFYVSQNNQIIRQSLEEEYFGVTYTYDNSNAFSLSSMIADENFVYYIADNKVFRLPANDRLAHPTELVFSDCAFDLGKVVSLKGLSFKHGNLIITDYAGSVQEYEINGDSLEFTGYAVASGLSAYNRVGETAKNIERYGDYVAALDNKKLTVIDTADCADYDKSAFINLFVDDAPLRFALGNDTILYSKGKTLNLVRSIKNGETMTVNAALESEPKNISYQSGKFYAVYTDSNDSYVAIIDEKTGELSDTVRFSDIAAKITANTVCADVFKNVYIADSTKIYKYRTENGSFKTYTYSDYFINAKKLATDLAGNLFALSSEGKIYRLSENDDGSYEFSSAYETPLGRIKTFGLNFDKKETYFLIDGEEEIFVTTELGNAALTDFAPTEEFKNAVKSKAELKVYTANSNANVYSVKAEDREFVFNGIIGVTEEYPLIAVFRQDALTLYALASENGVVLINEKELTEKITEYKAAPPKAIITTEVSAYALPVIDRNGTFVINTESGVRLKKGAEISASQSFTLLGKTFYEAEITDGDKTISCYIPADFTMENPIEDLDFDTYTIETVKDATLYEDEGLTIQSAELKDGDTVRVIDRKGGVLKVFIIGEDGEKTVGFISEKSVKDNPNATVRNVLIILAVIASVAGTISFFLLRKKR